MLSILQNSEAVKEAKKTHSAREFFRSKVREQFTPTADDPSLECEISEITDTVNFIIANAACPSECRGFIDAVIGAAEGRSDWFEASDLEIGKRMLGSKAEDKEKIALKKRVQRSRKVFNEWQYSESYIFIECEPGGQRSNGERFVSRYRVPLLKAAAEALRLAREDVEWSRSQSKALQRAARSVMAVLEGNFIKRDRFNRPRQDAGAIITKKRKTVLTLIKQMQEEIEGNGGNAENFLESLVRDILTETRSGIGNSSNEPMDEFVHTYTTYGQMCPQPNIGAREQGAARNTAHEKKFQGERSHAPKSALLQSNKLEPPDHLEQAVAMIQAFESIGVNRLDVTVIDDSRKNRRFNTYDIESLKKALGKLLAECEGNHRNLIVRPRIKDGLRLIQLDDLDQKGIERVQNLAFLVIETSSGNYQAWTAIEIDDEIKGVFKKIERRLKIGIGADTSASGATRLAGSLNFKEKYAPNYPRVRIKNISSGRAVTFSEIKSLLASDDCAPPSSIAPHSTKKAQSGQSSNWPSYERCLSDAPRAKNHDGADRSQADYMFCLFSSSRGHSVDETANRLMLESEKAKEKGFRYTVITARNAANKVENHSHC